MLFSILNFFALGSISLRLRFCHDHMFDELSISAFAFFFLHFLQCDNKLFRKHCSHFMLEFSALSLSLFPSHTHTHTQSADDGSSCPDLISRQNALSPGLFVRLCLQCSVVCSDSAALNSLRLPVLSSDRQFKASAPSSPLSVQPLHPSHCLPPRVSSLPQRWARSVSLSRIRGISLSHRGRVGQLSSFVSLPPLFLS